MQSELNILVAKTRQSDIDRATRRRTRLERFRRRLRGDGGIRPVLPVGGMLHAWRHESPAHAS